MTDVRCRSLSLYRSLSPYRSLSLSKGRFDKLSDRRGVTRRGSG